MKSPLQGTLGTILMLAPLAIVPALAILGLPPSRHLGASQEPPTLEVELGAPTAAELSGAAFPAVDEIKVNELPFDDVLNHPHGRLPATAAGSENAHNPQPASRAHQDGQPDWMPPQQALNGWSLDGRSPAANNPRSLDEARLVDITNMQAAANSFPNNPAHSASGVRPPITDRSPFGDTTGGQALESTSGEALESASGEALESAVTPTRTAAATGTPAVGSSAPRSTRMSWQQAVERLRQLGIQTYHLEPGATPNEFHFSCFYTPPDNPRITHRFEAEAAEPLRAVEKVMLQVEQWSGQR